jgi:predicted permease
MSQQFVIVAGQVSTLFLMIGVGFIMGKVGWLSRTGVSEMSTVLLYIVTPCIAIDVLQIDYTPECLAGLVCARW